MNPQSQTNETSNPEPEKKRPGNPFVTAFITVTIVILLGVLGWRVCQLAGISGIELGPLNKNERAAALKLVRNKLESIRDISAVMNAPDKIGNPENCKITQVTKEAKDRYLMFIETEKGTVLAFYVETHGRYVTIALKIQ